MLKRGCLLLCLAAVAGAPAAEQTDACAGLEDSALAQCRSTQQTLRQQEQLEQQLQQQQQRQIELDKEQREEQQQLEVLREENEGLRRQLERQPANPPARAAATAGLTAADFKAWRAANPWYGTDYAKTQVASRYMKQLQQQRPELPGRDLLDAVSAKVNETFPATR